VGNPLGARCHAAVRSTCRAPVLRRKSMEWNPTFRPAAHLWMRIGPSHLRGLGAGAGIL
jgi:hypothetical protein